MIVNKLKSVCFRQFSIENISPKMRAWQIYNYGDVGDLRLTDSYRTPPITNPNHVLVKVDAASVNPIDIAILGGYGASTFNIVRNWKNLTEFPKTLGRDFCGTVVKIGRNVKFFKPGMEVIGALWPFEEGSHAEFLVCHQNQMALKPEKLKSTDAAALPYAGLTAYSALVDFGGLKSGNAADKRILILGSSGGVGTIALQLAKAWGSYVAVTCREESEDILMELGADAIHGNELSVTDGKYDIIFDCFGDNFVNYSKFLKPDSSSRYITIKHSLLKLSDQFSPFLGIPLAMIEMTSNTVQTFLSSNGGIYQWAFFRASGANLSVICSLVDMGLIIPVVHAQYDFADAPQAYKCLNSGGIHGKVIIQMNHGDKNS